ncbi:MAG: AEC family transporter [Pseudomonadota bacterium]
MTLALTVLEIVAPVFLLAAMGYIWVRLGAEYPVPFVTRLAMTVAVPCLIFTALVETEIAPDVLRDTAAASVLAYALVGAAFWAGLRLSGLSQRTFWAPLTFGNTGNLGLPVALFAFGAEGLSLAVVVFALMAVMSFTLGVWVVSGGGSVWRALSEPLVAATLAGLVCLIFGMTPPVWAMNTLGLVGQLGIPLMLITLGVAISRLRPSALGRALSLSVGKLALTAGAAFAAAWLIGLSGTAAGVLVLQLTTPVAVTNYMLAEKYGADAAEVAGLVVVSTLLAVVSIPLILAGFVV